MRLTGYQAEVDRAEHAAEVAGRLAQQLSDEVNAAELALAALEKRRGAVVDLVELRSLLSEIGTKAAELDASRELLADTRRRSEHARALVGIKRRYLEDASLRLVDLKRRLADEEREVLVTRERAEAARRHVEDVVGLVEGRIAGLRQEIAELVDEEVEHEPA